MMSQRSFACTPQREMNERFSHFFKYDDSETLKIWKFVFLLRGTFALRDHKQDSHLHMILPSSDDKHKSVTRAWERNIKSFCRNYSIPTRESRSAHERVLFICHRTFVLTNNHFFDLFHISFDWNFMNLRTMKVHLIITTWHIYRRSNSLHRIVSIFKWKKLNFRVCNYSRARAIYI